MYLYAPMLFCSEMDDAFACMDDFHYHCNVNKQLEIDGMVSAYEYICRTGLDGTYPRLRVHMSYWSRRYVYVPVPMFINLFNQNP